MNKLKSLILVLLFLLIACEPDDICLDSIEDTPKLILRFFDKETTKFKSVTNFQISSLDSDNSLFFGETDSIAIPLNHKTDLSNFNFTINSSNTNSNSDNILINYNRKPIYKSVGCGYILNYTIESLIIEKDSNNWIDRYNIYKSNVENETTRHIEIFH